MVQIVDFENYHHNSSDKYDLAISIEVAEHINEEYSNLFIDNLCSAADVVLFSAAIPYQSGDGHVNCQWPSYWQQKFNQRGFVPADFIRREIWNNDKVALHCRQNICLYISEKSEKCTYFKDKISDVIDVVHPKMFGDIMWLVHSGNY